MSGYTTDREGDDVMKTMRAASVFAGQAISVGGDGFGEWMLQHIVDADMFHQNDGMMAGDPSYRTFERGMVKLAEMAGEAFLREFTRLGRDDVWNPAWGANRSQDEWNTTFEEHVHIENRLQGVVWFTWDLMKPQRFAQNVHDNMAARAIELFQSCRNALWSHPVHSDFAVVLNECIARLVYEIPDGPWSLDVRNDLRVYGFDLDTQLPERPAFG